MRCARFAIAILAAVASLAAESHRTAAAEPSRDRETVISRVSVGLEGSGRFEGGSAPHARIALVLGDRPVGETTADSDGAWRLSVTKVLAAGEHRVRIVARTGEAGEPSISPTVRISIPATFAAPPAGAETAEGDLIRRAGELADRASEAFDELLPRLIDPPGSPDEADLRAQPSSRVKLAAFQASQPASIHGDAATGEGLLQWLASILADAEAWLEASARDYQSVIVRRLAEPPPTMLGAPKAQPSPVTRAAEAERLREAEAKRAAEEARRQEQLAKAEAEARRASEADAKRKAAEEARRQQELAKAEAETRRKVGEAQRLAEAEAKRKAADEARRRQELARAEEEAARKTADARRLAEAEAKRQEADDLRRQQELAKAEAEAQRIAAAELRRQPQSAEPPASQEQGARSMSVAVPAPLGTTKRTAPRKARRDKPQLVRYTGVTAGSGNWCDFFQYSYPMELLDPGHWLSASAGRR